MLGRALKLLGQTVTVATLVSGTPALAVTSPVLMWAVRSKVVASAAAGASAYALAVLRR
ncbi:hypothetical protein [Halodesulfovibrio marinisediminis]|uniref:Uncharacterized protein n=1 Tax=Halodesulfovibrio marinisediminis DSM 17456 TaxID=1121457 RepID=A0A1N6FNM9_9BACT|nr:hypothetical protein [Halodesulfovibrio marinisediminis]SIN96854.1 hypothetical protein SAMN02745161_1414 [Halodesulfovibrio marinisediminis DSM 17456]